MPRLQLLLAVTLLAITIHHSMCTAATPLAEGIEAGTAPGSKFNLKGWKLQTCLKTPREVKGESLKTYQNHNFYLDKNGAMVFMTEDDGEPNFSSHPRTELREVGVPDWKFGKGVHEMTAKVQVTHVAKKKPETIIGQIHGDHGGDERTMLCILNWKNGKIVAQVKEPKHPYHTKFLELGSYKLGETIHYKIRMDGTKLTVTVNGKTVTYHPPHNSADKFYFKAGNYNQCNKKCDPHDHATVRFYSLRTTHSKAVAGSESPQDNNNAQAIAGSESPQDNNTVIV